MEEPDQLTGREVTVEDYAMITAWADSRPHTVGAFDPSFAPPCGIIIERNGIPEMCAFLYLSVGIGVAFVDLVFTRPGVSLAKALETFDFCSGLLRAVAKTHDYGVIRGFTANILSRMATRKGWQRDPKRLYQIAISTI